MKGKGVQERLEPSLVGPWLYTSAKVNRGFNKMPSPGRSQLFFRFIFVFSKGRLPLEFFMSS